MGCLKKKFLHFSGARDCLLCGVPYIVTIVTIPSCLILYTIYSHYLNILQIKSFGTIEIINHSYIINAFIIILSVIITHTVGHCPAKDNKINQGKP